MEQNRLIEMELHKLDCVASKAEAIYGVGNLLEWMPEEFKQKWQRQREKLDAAVQAQDAALVALVVDGTIRGWNMMEEHARSIGKPKAAPEYMEIKLDSGFHLRIAANVSEARQITAEGVYVWSIEEVARVLESEYTLVNAAKDLFPEARVVQAGKATSDFDFKNGDPMPEL